ncbi:conserved hypothetical protein [Roseibium sp. TrichSKD4]|uniref:hypothetical protein n=1 Tax=Roseibium sp. TrichSKD4 TaxID=744980 RepID=UPI0001E56D1D|nr:hypothetical protein [Roseibium sp. TrichSKD4]EFO30243.1 conserved hypothetical protein [Roseibium sp. TrichSKD4]
MSDLQVQTDPDSIDIADLNFSDIKIHPDIMCPNCPNSMVLFVTYDDFFPSPGCPFHVIMEGGAETNGTVGDNGLVVINGIPQQQALALVGEDALEYTPENQQRANPDYRKNQDIARNRAINDQADQVIDELKPAWYDFWTDLTPEEQARLEAAEDARQRSQDELKRLDADDEGIFSWIWGTIKGEWNDNPTVGQIICDAAISAIPVIDQIADLRDIVAVVVKLCDRERREREGWVLWLTLAITAIGLIPTLGSILKGFFKIILKKALPYMAKASDFLTAFKKIAAPEMINQVLEIIRYFHKGNAVKWLQDQAAAFSNIIQQTIGHLRRFLAEFTEQATKKVADLRDSWVVFYWESKVAAATDALNRIIELAGMAIGKVTEMLRYLDEVIQEFVKRIIKYIAGVLISKEAAKELSDKAAEIFSRVATEAAQRGTVAGGVATGATAMQGAQ